MCVSLGGGFTMVLCLKKIDSSVLTSAIHDLKLAPNVTSSLKDASIFMVEKSSTKALVSMSSCNTEQQLDAICQVAVKKLDNIPFPFNVLGGSKIKADALSLINNSQFRSGAISILDSARYGNPANTDKNIVELARDKDTYKKLFAYVKQSASGSKTLTSILNNSTVEKKLYDYLNSQEALKLIANL